jgi:hypothetical protein
LSGAKTNLLDKQVLSEAPCVGVIVRGKGEQACIASMSAICNGRWPHIFYRVPSHNMFGPS